MKTVQVRRTLHAFVGGSALLLAALSACDESTGTGGAGGASTATYTGTACDDCDRSACNSERAACAGVATCASYLTCLGACPLDANSDADGACEAACAEGSGSAELEAFRTCRTEGAGTTCADCPREGSGGAGGGTPLCTSPGFLTQECGPDNTADACYHCMYENCCDSADAVFIEPGPTQDLANCWLDCGDPICEEGCYATYPDGIAEFAAWQACLNVACAEPEGPCAVSDPCNECAFVECECEYASCLGSPDCFLGYICFSECDPDDVECASDCVDAVPANEPGLTQYFNCTLQRCGSQCGS